MSGKPTLYYAPFSPPARACMITAKLIGLDVDLKYVAVEWILNIYIV